MFWKRTHGIRGWLAGLLAATVLLSVPASALNAEPAAAADELAAAGILARGSGYTSRTGSQPVRDVQRRLRRLGDRPGPIDGLYGPLTEGAVERFQAAQGLATDGVVGPRTKTRLLAQEAERQVADTSRQTHADQLSPKSRAGGNSAESAIEQPPHRNAPSEALNRAGPRGSQGAPPELLALLAALATGALVLALRIYGRHLREATVSFGMVCAALLAIFVIGAATGAVFATHAAPDAGGVTFADSGALLARSAPSHPPPGETPGVGSAAQTRRARPAPTARRPAPPARLAARPAPQGSYAPVQDGPVALPAPASAPPKSQALVERRRTHSGRPSASTYSKQSAASTYTVRPGDALWPIAERHLAPGSSIARVAKKVEALGTLNEGRIASRDPNVLEAGERLRLR